MPRAGARSTSRSNSNISMMETCWNWNLDCAPQAESRCPGKANKPEGACRHPDPARLAEVKTPQEFLASEAQLAGRARLDREEMIATMAEVRMTFEAEKLALARVARERERELMGQVHHQTAAAKRHAEIEAESRYVEMLASERQPVVAATNQSVHAKTVIAAVAAARVEGKQIATARAEREKQDLQEKLKNARQEVLNTQVVAAKIAGRNNRYRDEPKPRENARASLQRMQSSNDKCPPAKPTGTDGRPLPAAQSSGTTSVPPQSDMTTGVNAGSSTSQARAAPQPQPAEREEPQAESSIVAQFCSICFNPRTGSCAGWGLPACKDHFDASTRRCSKCTPQKSERSAANV
eukprot:9503786-Pyramimonas_sp.AAC.1